MDTVLLFCVIINIQYFIIKLDTIKYKFGHEIISEYNIKRLKYLYLHTQRIKSFHRFLKRL